MKYLFKPLSSQRNSLTKERDELKTRVNDFAQYAQDEWSYSRGSFYYLSTIQKTWQNSRYDCWQRGADLMIVNSKEEEVFTRKPQKVLWIGLSERSRGLWKWVDGTPLTKSYWYPGEPNNYKGRVEDCAEVKHYSYEYSWNDAACTNENFFICEKKMNV
ncbi:CD209 antigen-like protein A [Leuresthes tenuis]|uniref:CD209 antigen-like protein A n=1 Tax=Leuresthes tenuis TaxID=355514 RepID=UPI003B51389D